MKIYLMMDEIYLNDGKVIIIYNEVYILKVYMLRYI